MDYACDLIVDIMPLVRDGVASDATRRALEEHIRKCDSCSLIYGDVPAVGQQEDAAKTLRRIRKRLTLSAWLAVLAAVILGGSMTMTGNMGYNLILFPLMGMAAFCLLGKQAWATAVFVVLCSFAFLMVRLFTAWAPASWEEFWSIVLFSLCYGAGFFIGAAAAWLLRYAFRKTAGQGKRQRLSRVCLGVLALVLWGVILYAFDFFAGNPVSYAAVSTHAESYLEEKYPKLNPEMGDVKHDWYNGACYWVRVTSPVSVDTEFTLFYDRLGRLTGDTYTYEVTSGRNTFARISREFDQQMEDSLAALEKATGLTVNCRIASDWGSIYDEFGYPFGPEKLHLADLAVDSAYDVSALAREYGLLELDGGMDVLSAAAVCRVLTQAKAILEAHGLQVACMDVTLYDDMDSVTIAGFRWEDIGAPDMEEKVLSAARAWESFDSSFDEFVHQNNDN